MNATRAKRTVAQEVIDFELVLDNDHVVYVRLPKRLSQPEAARLLAFISSLIRPEPEET